MKLAGNLPLAREARPAYSPIEAVWSLLAKLDIIEDELDEADLLQRLGSPSRPVVVSFVNQHAVNLAWSKPEFASALGASQVLLRDGVGIDYGLRLNGCPSGLNMNGTDFIPKLAQSYAGRSVALFGTCEPWIGRAASILRAWGCDIVSTLDGFLAVEDYIAEVARISPSLVILAMGMPRQEIVASAIAASAKYPVVVVNGGAIADFLAGRFKRAPNAWRVMGLEWAYRLAREPRRLSSRYLSGGVVFLWRLVRLRYSGAPVLARLLRLSQMAGTTK